MVPRAPPPVGALLRPCILFRLRPEPERGIKAGLVAAVAIFVAIVFLSCRAGFGSRVRFRVSNRPVPIQVDYRESDRVGLWLSRLAPFTLLAVLAVNRVDEKQFGAANPPRHGCVHFSSPLGVNKQKEPPRAGL